jgi:hypothetical protein
MHMDWSVKKTLIKPITDFRDEGRYLEEYMVLNMKMGNGKVGQAEN